MEKEWPSFEWKIDQVCFVARDTKEDPMTIRKEIKFGNC